MAHNFDMRRQGVGGHRFLGFVALAVTFHVGWWLIAPSDEEFIPDGIALANVVALLVGFAGDRLLRSTLSAVLVPFVLTTIGMVAFLVIETYRNGSDHITQLTSDPAVSVAIAVYTLVFLFCLSFVVYGLAALIGVVASLLMRAALTRGRLDDASSQRGEPVDAMGQHDADLRPQRQPDQ